MKPSNRARLLPPVLCVCLTMLISACSGGNGSAISDNGAGSGGGAAGTSLASGYRQAQWQSGVTVSFPDDCTMTFSSAGNPSHGLAAYYLVPGTSDIVATTPIGNLPLTVSTLPLSTTVTSYTLDICPQKADTATTTGGGAIGWMISGAAMFNPYEADMSTVAMADNASYTFTDGNGITQTASFLDTCNGHETPTNAGAEYHYHSWSSCLVTEAGDTASGPSHIIGIANDGFPIYGDRDIDGKLIDVSQLDECNGLTSATPEFPNGVYHYVLPSGATTTSQAAPRCLHGTVPSSLSVAIALRGAFCSVRPTYTARSAFSAPAAKLARN